MAIYLYECAVHGQFEEWHSMSDKLELCPECLKVGVETPVKRLINFGGQNLIKMNDPESIKARHNKEVADFKKEVATNEYALANLIGETKYNQQVHEKNRSLDALGSKFSKGLKR